MVRFPLFLLALATLGPDAFAQSSRPFVTRRAVDLGTYHVATGTWTPAEEAALTSELSIYDNTCLPQTLGGAPQVNAIVQLDPTEINADTGQIPSTGNTALVGMADAYTVQGWRWAICPGEPDNGSLTMNATMFFLEAMDSCGTVGGTPAASSLVTASIQVTGLPPGGMSGTCFVFDVDIEGTALEFDMLADADGTFDGPGEGAAGDTFGIAMTLERSDGMPFQGANAIGIAGDPGTNANSFGCQDVNGNPGPGGFIGESTSFLNPLRHVDGSTGFGSDDFLEAVGGTTPGCYFIGGGYAASSPVLALPWASLHCEIYGVPVVTPPSFPETCNGDGGDQMGCTPCPCSNDAPPGTVGGCLNSSGAAARLIPSGGTSAGAGDTRFDLTGGVAFSFAVLTSGDNVAPANAVNPCFGLSSGVQSVLLDGLRCAVTNTQRHGGRPVATDGTVGTTTNGWGPPSGPPGGISTQGGFVGGQTRHFQVFYRELPGMVCGTEQNTSNAVTVTFTP